MCLQPFSGMLTAWIYRFSLQWVAVFSSNKLKKHRAMFGVMQRVPQRAKLTLFCWSGVEKGIPLDVDRE